MNSFKIKKINNNKIITIVNVGSYKVRVAICSFSFSGVKILGYGEKRQSRLDVINNDINNISGICNTIQQAITKAEIECGEKPDNIVINPFFSNIFYYSKTIGYKNIDANIELGNSDIYKIINNIEGNSLDSIMINIGEKFGFENDNIKLILSNISSISIDGRKVKSLFKESGKNIKINILNSFILKSNYNTICNISDYLNKNILHIIPEEYAITKLGEKGKEIVFIDIGNSRTSISIKNKDESLKGALNIDVGIGDLVKEISKTSTKSRGEIIKKLDRTDLFKEEKENFLLYFIDILIEGLKEILKGTICPYTFVLVGGGANNFFIKDYLLKKDFSNTDLKIVKTIEFIPAPIDEIKKIGGVEDILKISNINIIAQIITMNNILNSGNDIMEKALEESIKNTLNL